MGPKKDHKKEEVVVVPEVVAPKIEYGSFIFPDNSTYDGEFETKDGHSTKHGKGRWRSGPESYNGDWAHDSMNGEGEYRFCSGK